MNSHLFPYISTAAAFILAFVVLMVVGYSLWASIAWAVVCAIAAWIGSPVLHRADKL